MVHRRWNQFQILALAAVVMMAAGCGINRQLRYTTRQQSHMISNLNDDLNRLSYENEELQRAKRALESRLSSERQAGDIDIQMTGRGLVITVVEEVLFDSGKKALKSKARETLLKVAEILEREGPDQLIAVEGHTDTEPIRVSGYRSNWELSTARALEVLHFFIDEAGISPTRLKATGYGEHQPRVSNSTPQGRGQNRRVEIVLEPRVQEKNAFTDEAATAGSSTSVVK